MKKATLGILIAGLIAAIVAAFCCLVPIIILSLGLSSAWVSTLAPLNAYRPLAIIITLVCIGFAYWKLYHSKSSCQEKTDCATTKARQRSKVLFWCVSIIAVLLLISPWFI